MVKFEFELENKADVAGFSLGHLSVSGELGSCSSKGRKPSRAMMIFVAITDLLDGVRKLVAEGKRKGAFEFVGADSSFTLRFQVRPDGRVRVLCGKDKPIAEVSIEQLCTSLLESVEQFLRSGAALPDQDAAGSDLQKALQEFSQVAKVRA